MGQALYRKYRSKKLTEIVGQEHITDTLTQALKSGRISHAYLFTGPRGVGKTSIARILAHEINDLPYDHEDNHIDIIEIDAASNRGIDEIRELREKVYSAPVSAKYKVYIIDEVHMLTTPAFNALLKTLEEPPAHVVFILATTEAHKLPETIISRTQRHIFRPVEKSKVMGHLKYIAKTEKIAIDDDALELLAEHGGGSFRDSISLLDQAAASDRKITRDAAEHLLGIPPDTLLHTLLQALAASDSVAVVSRLEDLQASGYHPAAIAKKLGAILRQQLLDGTTLFQGESQLQLMRALLDVAPAHDPLRTLEVILLTAAKPAVAIATTPAVSVPDAPTRPKPKLLKPETVATEPISPPEPPADPEVAKPHVSSGPLDAAIWPDVLNALKSKYNTLYGIMRMAVPEFEPGLVRLRFQFAFHQKRMNEAKHRDIIAGTIQNLTGQKVAIECVHDKEALVAGPIGSTHPAVGNDEPSPPPDSLATISNIFGGGELLES